MTQAVCAVCAVSYDEVCSVAGGLPGGPEVVSLDPETLEEVFADLPRLASACGAQERGDRLRATLTSRVERVRSATARARAPRVVALEWLDPPYIGGHWVPEMIAAAGGIDVLGPAGAKSRTATWAELGAARARDRGGHAVRPIRRRSRFPGRGAFGRAPRARAARVVAVDAASSFSRPGPRLADGVELLGHLLHPELVDAPAGLEWRELDLARSPA